MLELADYAIRIEDHYSQLAGHPTPMDIEWAKDGEDGKLYIVQARPETVASQRVAGAFETYALKAQRSGTGHRPRGRREDRLRHGPRGRRRARPRRLSPGRGAGGRGDEPRLGAGDEDRGGDRHQPRRTHLPRRDCRPRARRAGGGRRRRGAGSCATGTLVTVSCADGEAGKVYDGQLPFEVTRVPAGGVPRPRTEIMVNLGNPELAYHTAMLPNDGVGLARMEFIINEHIGVHPMALACPEKVASATARAAIARLVRNYPHADRFLRREARGGRRHDRRRILSQAGHRAAVGFQDQRICAA